MLSSPLLLRAPTRARRNPLRKVRFVVVAVLAALTAATTAGAFEVRLTDAKGQPISDAVVSLVPLSAPAKIAPPSEPIVVTQRGQEFSPYVTALVVGSQVNFTNNDEVEHHVYSLSGAKRFDLPLSGGQTRKPVLFDHAGVVSVGCNIHEWMSAYVIVLATPFFATSSSTGTAVVAEAPEGRYRVEIWHPRLAKPHLREISLPAPTLSVALTLGADRRIRRSSVPVNGGSYK